MDPRWMTRRHSYCFPAGRIRPPASAWALERFARVETLGFDYGQRNRAELACRDELRAAIVRDFPRWAARLGTDHGLALPALNAMSDSALTRDLPITSGGAGTLPSTFVPGPT
jgi:7-cyano-7-deazaguanine synthase